ncbi:metallophosphoesterase [Anaerotruncus rubiinfantis]|uniref:metallophosphoesterase n=1 Tax=Anaerotruncus rubiinfantis TaxID=1720200 RepID=UPI0034A57119
MKQKGLSKRIWVPALGLLLVILAIAFYSGYTVRHYRVTTQKLPTGSCLRAALVTDLHAEPSETRRKRLAALLESAEPDVILLCGDIYDDWRAFDGADAFLSEIAGLAPLYYVTGNHEIWSKRMPEILSRLKAHGVTVLENDWVTLPVQGGGEILMAGLADPDGAPSLQAWADNARRAFTPLETDGHFRLLLSHRPEQATLYAQLPFDLTLSGHAHGGQVRIPGILNGLYAPNQGFFPKYAGGWYEDVPSGQIRIVGRGVSHYWILPRVCNPPELVCIELKGAPA